MTLLGVASGFLTLVTAGLLGNPPMAALVFGMIIGTYLWQIGLATGFRAIAFAILSLLSWMAVARFVPRSVDLAVWQELVIAGGAGLLGAVLLVTSIVVLLSLLSQAASLSAGDPGWLRGGISVGFFPPLAELFPPCPIALPEGLSCPSPDAAATLGLVVSLLSVSLWQGAFAYCFALGFPNPAADQSSR